MKDAPNKKAVSTKPTAGQLWRDRLNKTKATGPGAKSANTPGKAATSTRNKFTQTASGSTDRKSRKGMRPG